MLKVFLVVAVAYLLKRLGILREEDSKVLVSYVINFALPLLAFKSMHEVGVGMHLLRVPLSAWIVILSCMALAFVVGKLLSMSQKDMRTFFLISSFGNTAFLGYPITYAYFGKEGLFYAIVYDSLGSFLLVSSVGVAVASSSLSLKPLVKFAPFWGLVLGLILSPYELPPAFEDFLGFVSLSVLPVILFSVGLNLSLGGIGQNLRLSSLALLIKMVLAPLIALSVGKALGLSGLERDVVVLESSMPTMIMASIIAMRYGLNHHLAFASAGLGMLLSFLWSPLIIKLLRALS